MRKSIIILSTVALLAGCASDSALRADVAAAKAAAEKAYQAAQQANLNAQDAKAMSLRTDEKLNRMFRKAQLK